MFAFKIWGKFACFRDPLSISQNITLPLPPKTTVGGMLAALLGVDDYLGDDDFMDFGYSVVLGGAILKKTFSQNYINDYTKKTKAHLNSLKNLDMQKISNGLRDKSAPQKPINRELLIDPRYTIFIDKFKFENEAIDSLKNRISKFPFYLGNSEFAGNFEFMEIINFTNKNFDKISIDSFVPQSKAHNICFDENILYSPICFAGSLDNDRSPKMHINLIVSNDQIRAKNIEACEGICAQKTYRCIFV